MRTAIATASYGADFERCRLLCDSIDARVSGHTCHYLLVEAADFRLFRTLEGPRRRVIDERSLLPVWLRPFPDPLSFGRRRIWLSPKGPPLRGWHVQQLRKIAAALALDEDAIVYSDSDLVFVKDTDLADHWQGEAFRFYRSPQAVADDMREHRAWLTRAGTLLGLPGEGGRSDYIAGLAGWRTDTARAMIDRIEGISGRGWAAALASSRILSEYMIYGRFVDEVENRPERHTPFETPLCHTYWTGAALTSGDLRRFTAELKAMQVAVGVQSFIGTDISLIRAATGLG